MRPHSSAWMLASAASLVFSLPLDSTRNCEQTDVLILGAGAAGISAGKVLAEAGITNFLILEYNQEVGRRVRHTAFGQKLDNSGPYTVELGANWIHSAGNNNGVENPIWTLAQKYGLHTALFDESETLTYNESGPVDFTSSIENFERASQIAYEDQPEEIRDDSFQVALKKAGWNSDRDFAAQAVEANGSDYDFAISPDFAEDEPDYGSRDDFVLDPRGYNYILQKELETYMGPRDDRLRLQTVVKTITASNGSVVVQTEDGNCIKAQHAICTFSIGVLQNAAVGNKTKAPVSFDPPLPSWKQDAIAGFGMAIYTKIFMQFNSTFWPNETENFMYASSTDRGYYVSWQSLTPSTYLPGSNIIFATVTTQQSHRIEAQSDESTIAQALEVLGDMFGAENVADLEDFMYPRWGYLPWSYGSYCYWPAGYTFEQHQDLRASVGNLWFAGEALEVVHQSTVHGARCLDEWASRWREAGRLSEGECDGVQWLSEGRLMMTDYAPNYKDQPSAALRT